MKTHPVSSSGFSRRAALGLGGGVALAGVVGCQGSTKPSSSSSIAVEREIVD